MNKLIKSLYYTLLLITVNMQIGYAQAGKSDNKKLAIGDAIPNISITNFLEQPNDEFYIDPNSDKLLLIDFFTTYCATCIASFPKLNNLKTEFGGKIDVLMVSPEKRDRLSSFMGNNNYTKANKLPVVVQDTLLSNYFPFKSVPHIAWIYRGKLMAVTGADMVNKENLSHVLGNGSVAGWPLKDDYYEINSMAVNTTGIYSSVSGYVNGIPLSYHVDTVAARYVTNRMVNVPIIQAYLYAYSKMQQLPFMKDDRIILAVKDKSRFVNSIDQPNSLWMQDHAITYESVLPIDWTIEERMQSIIKDLNNKLRVKIYLTKQEKMVWVIKDGKTKKDYVESSNGQPVDIMATLLDIADRSIPPIINEAKTKRKVNIKFDKDFGTLRNSFQAEGLDLRQEKRLIDVLVIED